MDENDNKLKDAIEAVLADVPCREAERRFSVPAPTISLGAKAVRLFAADKPVITRVWGVGFLELALIGGAVFCAGFFVAAVIVKVFGVSG